jgi:hypothetical protein
MQGTRHGCMVKSLNAQVSSRFDDAHSVKYIREFRSARMCACFFKKVIDALKSKPNP